MLRGALCPTWPLLPMLSCIWTEMKGACLIQPRSVARGAQDPSSPRGSTQRSETGVGGAAEGAGGLASVLPTQKDVPWQEEHTLPRDPTVLLAQTPSLEQGSAAPPDATLAQHPHLPAPLWVPLAILGVDGQWATAGWDGGPSGGDMGRDPQQVSGRAFWLPTPSCHLGRRERRCMSPRRADLSGYFHTFHTCPSEGRTLNGQQVSFSAVGMPGTARTHTLAWAPPWQTGRPTVPPSGPHRTEEPEPARTLVSHWDRGPVQPPHRRVPGGTLPEGATLRLQPKR